jgi:hypothetical protein
MKDISRLVAAVVLVGCSAPEPPSRMPDFVGLVVAVGSADGSGARVTVELAPATPNTFPTLTPGPGRPAVRAEVTLTRGAVSLARESDGTYRQVAVAPTWEGHPVQVWVAHAMSVPQDSSFEAEASTVVIDMPSQGRAP